jgi:hypothetical protein
MGFFSWINEEGESIRNRWTDEGPTPVKMIDDTGREWLELDYDGYGDFGGMDFYALVDLMNGGTGDRDRGIELSFGDGECKEPRLVTPECTKTWDELPPNESCPNQGYFDWA